MPILDPILQFNLSSIENSKSDVDPKYFYINYLQIASEMINQNVDSILTSSQFKKDFESCISFLSDRFSISFQGNKDDFPNIYFTILYQNNELDTSRKFNFQGEYYQYSILNSTFNFFKVNIDNNTCRSWFFSDCPIAVLVLHLSDMKDEHLSLITLELNLMAAASFTIVVCISDFSNCKITNFDRLIAILGDHFISEFHVSYDSDEYDESFNNFVKSLNINYSKFDGYFYFYVRYFNVQDELLNQLVTIPILDLSKKGNTDNALIKKLNENLNQLKLNPRMKITYFSDPIKQSLKTYKIGRTKFKYCKNGFEKNMIKIVLSDIPLYDKDDANNCIYSFDFANFGKFTYHCLIKKEDFLSFEKGRVNVLYYYDSKKDKNSKEEEIVKYVDFADIHFMNNKLYIQNQLSLAKTKSTLKKKCNSTIEKLKNNYIPREPDLELSTKKSPRKNNKGNKNVENSLDEVFTRSLYIYKVFHEQKYDWKFNFHLNQIYAAYEIINSCFDISSTALGSIYKIPTGEGKSAIILLIAAVLAQSGKKVHIVTSNYILANRDYNDSFDYFKKLKLNSAALLHFNEVPIYNNNAINDPNIKTDHYPDEFFGRDLFANSLSMNFAVCNKNTSIIFSTISNFECFYLYMTEKCKENIDAYYKKTILLVDEVDSILIDEITNGTIISRPLNSNCEQVLSHVYNTYIKNNKISASILRDDIAEKWPECTDLTITDVENMIKELSLVLKDPFVDGKKYLIVKSNKISITDE